MNGAGRAADIEFFLHIFLVWFAVAAVRVEKIFRDFGEIVRGAVGVLAFFRKPFGQLAAGGQTADFFAILPAKSRARAGA